MESNPKMPLLENSQIEFLLSKDSNVKFRKKSVILNLSRHSLQILENQSKSPLVQLNLYDVVGVRIVNQKSENHLQIITYEVPDKGCQIFCCCASNEKLRTRVVRTLSFQLDDDSIHEWADALHWAAYENWSSIHTSKSNSRFPRKSRRFVVFVNPVSGKRTALSIWREVVEPMLQDSGAEFRCVITERANHARDEMMHIDPLTVDAIIIIGGDGLIYEVINGMGLREDGPAVLKTLPIAPIPGGTGNGLVKSVLFEGGEDYSAVNASFVALKGRPSGLDLSVVQTPTSSTQSFLMLGWGLISDIDLLSETMRCLGETRLFLAAFYFIGLHRAYPGTLSMLLEGSPLALDSSQSTRLPLLSEPLPVGWERLEGEFILVWILQTSHTAATVYSGPGATLDDGLFTIFVVQDMSRSEMLQMLLDIDNGGHARNPKVRTYKALAYRLEPRPGSQGLYTLDGEVLEYGPVQAEVLPSAASILKTTPQGRG